MGIKTISEPDIAGRRLFIRVDFNVPLTPEGKVSDDTRIRESLPTIKLAIEKGARVVLASHLGRPRGRSTRSTRSSRWPSGWPSCSTPMSR